MDCFANGTYELADLDGTPHASRVNGLSLKIYHASLMLVQKYGELEDEKNSLKNVAPVEGKDMQSLFLAANHECSGRQGGGQNMLGFF